MAVKLNGVKCSADEEDANNALKLVGNNIFTGGVRNGHTWFEYDAGYRGDKKAVNTILGHCKEAQADTVFMFLTAIVLLVSGVMLFLRARKGY